MLRAFPRGLAIFAGFGLVWELKSGPCRIGMGMGTAYPDRARPITSPSIVRL